MIQKDELGEMFGDHIVEAFVGVDDKGQMVLPKDVRTRAGIKPGDKLALVSLGKEGKIGCFILVKADLFEHHVRATLGPVMNEIFKQ
jgi:antitoxin PrlF